MRRAWRKWSVRAAVYALVLTPPALILLAAYTGRPNDGGPLRTIAGRSNLSRIEPRFTAVARQFAGKGEVRCWSASEWADRTAEFVRFNRLRILPGGPSPSTVQAYLSPDRTRINLPAGTCNWIAVLAHEDWAPEPRMARAFTIFATMIEHLRGERNERVAECRGLQSLHDVAAALGVDESDASDLEELAWSLYEARAPRNRLAACHR